MKKMLSLTLVLVLLLSVFPSAFAADTAPDEPEPMTEAECLAAYAPVLDTYRSFLNGAEVGDFQNTERGDYYLELGEFGISELARDGGTLGYCLEDLDYDGIPELLIGASDAEYWDDTLIYDLYTLEDGIPVRISVSSARVRYYLCQEEAILFEGSGGAEDHVSLVYGLYDGDLELVYGLIMNGGQCYAVTEDRENLFSERLPSDRHISSEQFNGIHEELQSHTVPLDLKPLADTVP